MSTILRVCFPSRSMSTGENTTNLKKNPTNTVQLLGITLISWINVFINISQFSHNIMKVASPRLLVHLGLLCDCGLLVFLHPFKHGAISTASLRAILVRVV